MKSEGNLVFKAYGKCLIAGGYAILNENQPGLVIGSKHYFESSVIHSEKRIYDDSTIEILIKTPQFPTPSDYKILWDTMKRSCVLLSGNSFIDAAVNNALLASTFRTSKHYQLPSKISIEIHQTSGFIRTKHIKNPNDSRIYPVYDCPVTEADKTGLGSSAALIVSLTGVLLKLCATIDDSRFIAAVELVSHCANSQAQNKQGSGFDICAAVYGSHTFTRLPPASVCAAAIAMADGVDRGGLAGIVDMCGRRPAASGLQMEACELLLVEFASGSDTRVAVKQVMAWLDSHEVEREEFLQMSERLVLQISWDLSTGDQKGLAERCVEYRKLMRDLGNNCGVPVEPEEATAILDKLQELGALYAVCPGAGGYDALAVIVNANKSRCDIERMLEKCRESTKNSSIAMIS